MASRNSERRAGKRKDRNVRFATRNPVLGYYLIVTDAEETEKNYFEGLKNSIPSDIRDRIVIKVEKAKTTYKQQKNKSKLFHALILSNKFFAFNNFVEFGRNFR